ncbi:MAG: hypothetical protein JWQ30_1616 [Sediminibacterium sp.]|nr:hypothetical protein [Sediminibacterium sp.]
MVVFASCSSSKNSQQSGIAELIPWQKDSLVIDGNDGDWTGPLPYRDEKEGLLYAVSNDNDNLYIRATTQNDATILKILRGGLTVYINSHGVKEEPGAAGISFPTGNRVNKDGKLLNDRPELQHDKRIGLGAVQDYSIFGFNVIKSPENFDYGKSNPEGIQLAVGLNAANDLVYEAMIPLRSFLTRGAMVNLGRKNFAVGLVLENIPAEADRQGNSGVSVGGGVGLSSYGGGGSVCFSIGSDALTNLFSRKKPKPYKIWREFLFTNEPGVAK